MHPEDLAGFDAQMGRMLHEPQDVETERRFRRPDGSYRWIRSRTRAYADETGAVVRLVGTIIDITARKEVDVALREKMSEMEAVLGAVPAMVLLAHDPECRRMTANEYTYRMLRMPTGANPSKSAPPEAHQANFRPCRNGVEIPHEDLPMQLAARRGEEVRDEEYELLFDDGRCMHILGNAAPLRNAQGQIRGAVGAFIDITARKQVELQRDALVNALESERARFEAVLRQMPAGVVIAEAPAGRVTLVNQQIEEIFRHPIPPGATVHDFRKANGFGADGRPYEPHDWPLSRSFGSGETVDQEEIEIERDDGSRIVVSVSSAPIRDRDGRIVAAVAIHTDVTGQKKAEESLRRARDEATAASRAKTRLLASVSHDLRQPVQAASLFLNLLSQQALDEKARELVGMIGQSIGGLQTMLNGLLDVARLDAGMVKPEFKVFRLQDLLGRLGAEFGKQAEAAGLTFEVAPISATVRSDPVLLEQILRNLIANAIKFTSSGGVAISCREADTVVEIGVRDTGCGIPADQFDAIFEDFVQLANPARDPTRGLGLGLATVARTARLLGHPISVSSRVGNGSTFSLQVPLATTLQEVLPAAPPSKSRTHASPLEGRRVLLVEDDPLVLAGLEQLLRKWRMEVTSAGSLREVKRLLADAGRAADIMITDYRLPDSATGTDVALAVRERWNMPIVILTGDTSPDRLLDARRAHCALLHKPVEPDQLRETLARLL